MSSTHANTSGGWNKSLIGVIGLIVVLAIGAGGWDILVAQPVALFVYVVLDLLVLAFLLLRRVIRNEFAILFITLSLLYSHSFLFEALIGLTDPESFSIVINLSALGLDLLSDSSAVILASIIFRNALLLGWWRNMRSPLGLGKMLSGLTSLDFALVTLLTLFISAVAWALEISIVQLLAVNLFIAFVAMVCILTARWFRFRLSAILAVIVIAAVGLLFVGRSRLPIMVAGLSLVIIYFSGVHVRRWHQFLISCVLLVVFVAFGFLRAGISDRGARDHAGILSQEETGNVFLVGAHTIGLASRGQLPSELTDSLSAKIIRGIPGTGGSMLADRYVWTFFPAAAAYGGGFAYPTVAEWYILGGIIALIVAGMFFGVFMSIFLRHVKSGYATFVTIIFFAQFLRQEFSASLLTIITLIVGAAMLFVLKWLVILVGKPQNQDLSSNIGSS